jgi:hypothetical protein
VQIQTAEKLKCVLDRLVPVRPFMVSGTFQIRNITACLLSGFPERLIVLIEEILGSAQLKEPGQHRSIRSLAKKF